MIVDDLDVIGIIVSPHETHTPLIVNANAMLSFSIMGQRFKSVSTWYSKGIENRGGVQLFELACGRSLNFLRQFQGIPTAKYLLGFPVPEGSDHSLSITTSGNNVKRCCVKNQDKLAIATGGQFNM